MAIATVVIDFLGNIMPLVFAKKLFPELSFAKNISTIAELKNWLIMPNIPLLP